MNLRARTYHPQWGTFTSVDPVLGVGGSTGWNGYLYANANPVNLTDPSGWCVWEPGVDLISCGLENAGLLWGQVGSVLGLVKQAADNASAYYLNDLEASWQGGLSGWWSLHQQNLPHVWDFAFEVALPMLWEPADWISGLVNADPLALLPLVPSAARFASHASSPLSIGRRVLQQSEHAPLYKSDLGDYNTGVPRFDARIVGTDAPDYVNWANFMHQHDVEIDVSPNPLRDGQDQVVRAMTEYEDGKITVRVWNETRYIDLLHEKVHVKQYLKHSSRGVDMTGLSPNNRFYIDRLLFQAAYHLEIKLGNRYGFAKEYMTSNYAMMRGYWHDSIEYEYMLVRELRDLGDQFRTRPIPYWAPTHPNWKLPKWRK